MIADIVKLYASAASVNVRQSKDKNKIILQLGAFSITISKENADKLCHKIAQRL